MKFGANRSQLYDAQKTGRVKWKHATEVWNDDARRKFEEEIWEPLDAGVSEVLRAVDQLSVLFSQVRSDCEFNP